MHMLHVEGKIKAGRKDEFLTLWNSKILPEVKQQHGFMDEILLFEDPGNVAIALSFWTTRDDAEQFLRNGFDNAKSHVVHLLDGAVNIRRFDVKSSETFKITSPKAA